MSDFHPEEQRLGDDSYQPPPFVYELREIVEMLIAERHPSAVRLRDAVASVEELALFAWRGNAIGIAQMQILDQLEQPGDSGGDWPSPGD